MESWTARKQNRALGWGLLKESCGRGSKGKIGEGNTDKLHTYLPRNQPSEKCICIVLSNLMRDKVCKFTQKSQNSRLAFFFFFLNNYSLQYFTLSNLSKVMYQGQ